MAGTQDSIRILHYTMPGVGLQFGGQGRIQGRVGYVRVTRRVEKSILLTAGTKEVAKGT